MQGVYRKGFPRKKGGNYDIEMQSVPEGFLPQRSRYYHASMDTHILKKGIEQGIEQGRTEGIAEGEKSGFSKGEKSGIERGAAQKQREIAKNLKSLKLPVEQIRTATGLTLAEIEELQ